MARLISNKVRDLAWAACFVLPFCAAFFVWRHSMADVEVIQGDVHVESVELITDTDSAKLYRIHTGDKRPQFFLGYMGASTLVTLYRDTGSDWPATEHEKQMPAEIRLPIDHMEWMVAGVWDKYGPHILAVRDPAGEAMQIPDAEERLAYIREHFGETNYVWRANEEAV